MLYYMEPEYARGFYHLSLHDRAEFEIMRHFELFADRGQVWERVELLSAGTRAARHASGKSQLHGAGG